MINIKQYMLNNIICVIKVGIMMTKNEIKYLRNLISSDNLQDQTTYKVMVIKYEDGYPSTPDYYEFNPLYTSDFEENKKAYRLMLCSIFDGTYGKESNVYTYKNNALQSLSRELTEDDGYNCTRRTARELLECLPSYSDTDKLKEVTIRDWLRNITFWGDHRNDEAMYTDGIFTEKEYAMGFRKFLKQSHAPQSGIFIFGTFGIPRPYITQDDTLRETLRKNVWTAFEQPNSTDTKGIHTDHLAKAMQNDKMRVSLCGFFPTEKPRSYVSLTLGSGKGFEYTTVQNKGFVCKATDNTTYTQYSSKPTFGFMYPALENYMEDSEAIYVFNKGTKNMAHIFERDLLHIDIPIDNFRSIAMDRKLLAALLEDSLQDNASLDIMNKIQEAFRKYAREKLKIGVSRITIKEVKDILIENDITSDVVNKFIQLSEIADIHSFSAHSLGLRKTKISTDNFDIAVGQSKTNPLRIDIIDDIPCMIIPLETGAFKFNGVKTYTSTEYLQAKYLEADAEQLKKTDYKDAFKKMFSFDKEVVKATLDGTITEPLYDNIDDLCSDVETVYEKEKQKNTTLEYFEFHTQYFESKKAQELSKTRDIRIANNLKPSNPLTSLVSSLGYNLFDRTVLDNEQEELKVKSVLTTKIRYAQIQGIAETVKELQEQLDKAHRKFRGMVDLEHDPYADCLLTSYSEDDLSIQERNMRLSSVETETVYTPLLGVNLAEAIEKDLYRKRLEREEIQRLNQINKYCKQLGVTPEQLIFDNSGNLIDVNYD